MKGTFLMALALLISPSVYAAPTNQTCMAIYESAFQAMEKRQSGFLVNTVAKTAKTELERSIVDGAYTVPRYTLRERRYSASIQYANRWANECYERLERRALD
ncbi:hypothetical protein [Larsenimonas suaedae]|uniref:DUF4148 domain-containing protein n=1 Tax=Larsenimonas suaedae TaxID=1851019 RepID=A0ABU1GXQ1_9GAMM|nr:hypothetical protein [Larsenimonas suaedae]MCM2971522.1 hypothetical protein [Larsenimonas suaedae]MDR5896778.1 hypothetical protein [Larsenimonas suaedae]